jgi:hypothetical protein
MVASRRVAFGKGDTAVTSETANYYTDKIHPPAAETLRVVSLGVHPERGCLGFGYSAKSGSTQSGFQSRLRMQASQSRPLWTQSTMNLAQQSRACTSTVRFCPTLTSSFMSCTTAIWSSPLGCCARLHRREGEQTEECLARRWWLVTFGQRARTTQKTGGCLLILSTQSCVIP